MENPYRKNGLGDGLRGQCWDIYHKHDITPTSSTADHIDALTEATQNGFSMCGSVEFIHIIFELYFEYLEGLEPVVTQEGDNTVITLP